MPHLLLGAPQLRRGRALRVALEHVGEFGSFANQVQRIYADGVAGRIDLRALPGGLENPQLRLQLNDVTAKRLGADREVLNPR